MIVENIKKLVGNTPLFKLSENDNEIYVKLEKFNPAGSVKDRAVLNMLEDMETKHELNKGDVLIEATSGNTGIALALMGKVMGYEVIIIMPESMSVERQQLIKAYGATLILTSASLGMNGSITMMEELMAKNPHYKAIRQFDNPANNLAHYLYTSNEIIKEVPQFDYFISGIGTGATLCGCGKRFKEYDDKIKVIGVEPLSSPLITSGGAGAHKIQGIGANFIPKNYQPEYVDEVMCISDDEAYHYARLFMQQSGILVGISSGANIAAAFKLASNHQHRRIVTIAPDGGEKYLAGGLYD